MRGVLLRKEDVEITFVQNHLSLMHFATIVSFASKVSCNTQIKFPFIKRGKKESAPTT